jgi:4-diphosphocytidyl-2-C-methyl-D-erythritol kinase
MTAITEPAPAKVNLGLTLGPLREDGRHRLVTVMQPVDLCDRVSAVPASIGAGGDECVCEGVEGENLALAALRAFREATGWEGAPLRLEIEKKIPVAAGMAGGSADAGAALRIAERLSGIDDEELVDAVAAGLGSDVPAQLWPTRYLATGAGCQRPTSSARPTGSACPAAAPRLRRARRSWWVHSPPARPFRLRS